MHQIDLYRTVRAATERICAPLHTEDYVPQPMADVSPPKWHLAHTAWFFEAFILQPYMKGYRLFDPAYAYLFNSYYEQVGKRVARPERGHLSRPVVEDIYRYRKYVDGHMYDFMRHHQHRQQMLDLIELGLQHEQQHQELLITDIKYILGVNPLFPAYADEAPESLMDEGTGHVTSYEEGVYSIGNRGDGFCYDNELASHRVFLEGFSIRDQLVTNGEYLEFMDAGGYEQVQLWHADGWEWLQQKSVSAPLYWHQQQQGRWMQYTLAGLHAVNPEHPLCHISYYEAAAFAQWKGWRLPTEFEWEVAADALHWGRRWEWTESAYLPYPAYRKAEGAIGEYNGKFMVNQKVLRGGSVATAKGHSRKSYRNFFQADKRWQFTGIRLAR